MEHFALLSYMRWFQAEHNIELGRRAVPGKSRLGSDLRSGLRFPGIPTRMCPFVPVVQPVVELLSMYVGNAVGLGQFLAESLVL